MNLFDRDVFELYRLLLTTLCAVYAVVVTVRSLLFIAGSLVGSDKKAQVVRKYAVVLLLRMRISRFKRELAGIAAYSLILLVIFYWHWAFAV
ncbi:MAG: hypothetical protein KF841_05315 [Phycisphaerae bacterium]|nr:hypothetical protein [Phycisphaerae bacterium]